MNKDKELISLKNDVNYYQTVIGLRKPKALKDILKRHIEELRETYIGIKEQL